MENKANGKSFHRFLVLWSADIISSIAVGMTAFALGVYVFNLTGNATDVALVTLFAFLPSVLLNPLAGVLADRLDRRLLMIAGDSLSAVGLVYMLLCILSGPIEMWQIYLGVGVNSIFTALLEPSFKATITDLLTKEEFAKASGLVQLAGSAKFLLSPFIAGLLLSFTRIETILLIDISTLLVTLPATLFVKRGLAKVAYGERAKQSFWKDFQDGWRAITVNRGVLLVIVMISVATFYIGFLQTLFTPMLLGITDAKTLGVLESVSAVGMLVSSLLLGMVTVTKKYVRQLVTGLALAGVFIAMIGLKANVWLIGAFAFLFFAALPFVNTSADVLVRRNIPDDKQGRAWGLIGILSQLGFVIAYAVSGVLADSVFNPLLEAGGGLAPTVGKIIGTGQGRGIGLLLIFSGVLLFVLALLMGRVRSIRALEEKPAQAMSAPAELGQAEKE
ncbi:MAG: MFS transporter [Firmicutes bacterium]|nr:MFS transporter [Bacillota bacterium]